MARKTVRPNSARELEEVLRGALAEHASLDVIGAGTKRALGRPMTTTNLLDLSALSGIVTYEPEELVITAQAGTPIAEIEAALSTKNQMLAFEPVDLGPLFGARAGGATLGGMIATNASGPRRLKSGAARDHVLGIKAVSGRGESFVAGGRVVKNVTGYDLPKLLAGSFGTLAVMHEITLKLAPKPETEATLVLRGLDDAAAIRAMTAALQTPWDVSGAAHLSGAAMTALRMEGVALSVEDRRSHLKTVLGAFGDVEALERGESRALWQQVRDVSAFTAQPERTLWRLSVPPSKGADVVDEIRASVPDCEAIHDWGGGLIWLAVGTDNTHGAAVRRAAEAAGGHALLARAPEMVRASEEVFPPLGLALHTLTSRVKQQFDPERLLNPGRMYADI